METTANKHPHLSAATAHVVKRLIAIFENRMALALVEIQEEREKILRSLLFALVVCGCLMLAGVTLTILVAVAFWGNHPIAALACLMAVYLAVAVIFLILLARLRRRWEMLPSTIEQLKKDSECLVKNLS